MSSTSPDYAEHNLPYSTLAKAMGGLFVGILVIMGVMYLLFGIPIDPIEPKNVTERKMDQPTLQSRPALDQKTFRQTQEKHLSSYGWIDKSAGIVHIPVDRAIDLLLERGLPARGAEGNNVSNHK